MRKRRYGQFCPISKASEIVAERWTPLVLRELLMGSRRFNDIHRGVPLMSTSLLSRRLKELQWAGLVERRALDGEHVEGYFPTEACEGLRPILIALGEWGIQYLHSDFDHADLDPSLLMWDMRRNIRIDRLPTERVVVLFEFTDQVPAERKWWLLREPGATDLDLCLQDPGYDIDLTVSTDLRTMTQIWMGEIDLTAALRSGSLTITGSQALRLSILDWIGLSVFVH